jgi:flavin-dependent dehydrogenase
VPLGLSRFQQIVLHQGRIERFFLDHIKKHSKDTLRVERGVLPESLHISDDTENHSPDNYPITVQLRHLTEEEAKPAQSKGSSVNDGLFRSNLAEDDTDDIIAKSNKDKEGSSEIVRAKYMVGCDGAHSWTRRQLGFELEGEPTDFIWGVLGTYRLKDQKRSTNLETRYHPHHRLSRYSHAMCGTQRLIRIPDGYSP